MDLYSVEYTVHDGQDIYKFNKYQYLSKENAAKIGVWAKINCEQHEMLIEEVYVSKIEKFDKIYIENDKNIDELCKKYDKFIRLDLSNLGKYKKDLEESGFFISLKEKVREEYLTFITNDMIHYYIEDNDKTVDFLINLKK